MKRRHRFKRKYLVVVREDLPEAKQSAKKPSIRQIQNVGRTCNDSTPSILSDIFHHFALTTKGLGFLTDRIKHFQTTEATWPGGCCQARKQTGRQRLSAR